MSAQPAAWLWHSLCSALPWPCSDVPLALLLYLAVEHHQAARLSPPGPATLPPPQ